jgi:hypothetical protein
VWTVVPKVVREDSSLTPVATAAAGAMPSNMVASGDSKGLVKAGPHPACFFVLF